MTSHQSGHSSKKSERHLIHCPRCETQNYADNKECIFCFEDIQQYLKEHPFLICREFISLGDGNIKYV